MIEKINTIITRYKQSEPKDVYKIHDDIASMFVDMKLDDDVQLIEDITKKVSLVLEDIHASPNDNLFTSLATMEFIDFDETRDKIKILIRRYKNNEYKDVYEIFNDISSILSKFRSDDVIDIVDNLSSKVSMTLMDLDTMYDKTGEYYSIFSSKDSYSIKESIKASILSYLGLNIKDKISTESIIDINTRMKAIDKLDTTSNAFTKTFITMIDNVTNDYDKLFSSIYFANIDDKIVIRDILNINKDYIKTRMYQDAINIRDKATVKTFG
jgi:hypothetical protein